jgi:hypothetical protein
VQGDTGGSLLLSGSGEVARTSGEISICRRVLPRKMGLGLQNSATEGRQLCCLGDPCRMIGVGIMTWYKHSVEHWVLPKAIECRLMYSGGTENRIHGCHKSPGTSTGIDAPAAILFKYRWQEVLPKFLFQNQTAQGCLLQQQSQAPMG